MGFCHLVGPEQALVMEQELGTLLRIEAIEVVPPLHRESRFYSRYFQRSEGWGVGGGGTSDFTSAFVEPLSHVTQSQNAQDQTNQGPRTGL